MFIKALFTIAKIRKQPKCLSIDGWKRCNTYINGILLSHEKERNPVICTTWMALEGIVLSKVSQTQNDKYHMISFIYGI